MEKTHNDAHARSKRKSEFDSETVQCSQSGRQEPHKAKLFQEELLRKKNIATLHTLLTSQPLWNEDSIAVRPEWLVDPSWPPHFNKALATAKNNIAVADCRSPIVPAGRQPLWHNVAIRSVFIMITKRFAHLFFLAPVEVLRRKHSNYKELTKHELAGHRRNCN